MRPIRSIVGKFKNLLDNMFLIVFLAALVGIILLISKHK
jgi:hypothetical protein